jgi:hypothetical protein
LAVLGAALAAAAAWLHRLVQKFHFVDYVHAEKP